MQVDDEEGELVPCVRDRSQSLQVGNLEILVRVTQGDARLRPHEEARRVRNFCGDDPIENIPAIGLEQVEDRPLVRIRPASFQGIAVVGNAFQNTKPGSIVEEQPIVGQRHAATEQEVVDTARVEHLAKIAYL